RVPRALGAERIDAGLRGARLARRERTEVLLGEEAGGARVAQCAERLRLVGARLLGRGASAGAGGARVARASAGAVGGGDATTAARSRREDQGRERERLQNVVHDRILLLESARRAPAPVPRASRSSPRRVRAPPSRGWRGAAEQRSDQARMKRAAREIHAP